MARKRIHLVCNAHLDPVWLWPWEDGMTEALSTFRIAADFCERNAGFVFNHNEALLYHWVEQHEPQLFKRIVRLVKAGKWHIAGGAWLQPDVNGTSGESHIRQFLYGLNYFKTRFGVRPTTAYNFDPFGHGEGFPQILRGCGMDSYIFCRPDFDTYTLPKGIFSWRDRSGTTITARRSDDHYLSNSGIIEKLDEWLKHYADEPETMILWGIGNHGGGPSQDEYDKLLEYIRTHPEYEWLHSTPEAFFDNARPCTPKLPIVASEIQNSFPGCYTSMSRVKRAHRQAEQLIAQTERLAALAWWLGVQDYPEKELNVAWKDILFAEFHDILPGSGIPSVEQDSIMLLDHAQEILRRVRATTIVKLAHDDPAAEKGRVPVFIHNPHGFKVKNHYLEFECNLAHKAPPRNKTVVVLECDGKKLPYQRIKAEHNNRGDWRIRLATTIELQPWELKRLEVYFSVLENELPTFKLPKVSRAELTFKTAQGVVCIDPKTGLIDRIIPKGSDRSLVKPNAFQPVLYADLNHSWTCGDPERIEKNWIWSTAPGWDKPFAEFKLATIEEVQRISPAARNFEAKTEVPVFPLRIVESGKVVTVVEAIFVCAGSALVRNYVICHLSGQFQIRDRIFMNHRDKMLKLRTRLNYLPEAQLAEALYSVVRREPTIVHEDRTQGRWSAVTGDNVYLACANTGSFAGSLTKKEWTLNLLRTPAYASFSLNTLDRWQTRGFVPRQDQGEHLVAFELYFGRKLDEIKLQAAAEVLNIAPSYQVYYPQTAGGAGNAPRTALADLIVIEPKNVAIVAIKKAEAHEALIVRLQERAGIKTLAKLRLAGLAPIEFQLNPYALKTLRIARKGSKRIVWVNLVEEEEPVSRS